MKIGSKIYCHRPVIMKNSKKKVTTVGKIYTVVEGRFYLSNEFCIIDDEDEEHYFYLFNYKDYFCNSLKELREKKLRNIIKQS